MCVRVSLSLFSVSFYAIVKWSGERGASLGEDGIWKGFSRHCRDRQMSRRESDCVLKRERECAHHKRGGEGEVRT